MPSLLHESVVEMFAARPGLAAEILSGLDVDLAARHDPRPASAVLAETRPVERRADTLLLHGDRDRPAAAVVVEVQLRTDLRKRKSWPSYLALARERHDCPVYLLVVCLDDDVARWSRAPVDYGHPGLTLVPVVLGPDRTPLVDPDAAPHRPEAAVLAALAHGGRPTRPPEVVPALLAALDTLDRDHADLYFDAVMETLSVSARQELEELMSLETRTYSGRFAQTQVDWGVAQGLAKGRAESRAVAARAVVTVLVVRGLAVPDHVRERVHACTDLDTLDRWVRRAATATTATDIFGPDPGHD